MKTVAVINPKAGGGRLMRHWSDYDRELRRALGEVEVRRTERAGDGARLVREAVREGVERVVVVGGDGTACEAVNGLFAEDGRAINPDVILVYLPAGTYRMYAVPTATTWKVVLNSDTGWGAREPDHAKDVLSVEVPSEKTQSPIEQFTISFTPGQMDFSWDTTLVHVPLS